MTSIDNLAMFPTELQSYDEARSVINKILQSNEKNNLSILQRLLEYAEIQFGGERLEKGFRSRNVESITSSNLPGLHMVTNEENTCIYIYI